MRTPNTASKALRSRPANTSADDAKRLTAFTETLLPLVKPCTLISGAILIATLVGSGGGDEMLQTTMYDPHARELLTAHKACHKNTSSGHSSCVHARPLFSLRESKSRSKEWRFSS